MQSGLKAVVFGATGAIGKTLTLQLAESNKWSKVLCVVRNQPEEWNKYINAGKLEVQIEKDMDKIFKVGQWSFNGFDAMFVCFGSEVKNGSEIFRKVDKQYPVNCAQIAVRNKIPHYLVVSSAKGDADSWLFYLKVKGEMERDLKQKKLPLLTILKPGVITNRPDARFGEKVFQFFSFLPIPLIDCNDLALSLKGIAQTKASQAHKFENKVDVYENQDLLNFIGEYKPKEYPNSKP